MADTDNFLQADCVEILVKTECDVEPRGQLQDDPEEMSSFEKLVHTALGMEKDPCLTEHDYFFSNKMCVRNDHSYSSASGREKDQSPDQVSPEVDLNKKAFKWKDHSYFAYRQTSKLQDQFTSNEDLSQFEGTIGELDKYRSNDSALDVTSFETISDKCLSHESVNLQTVEVFTEQRLRSATSDPDISKMTIDSNCETLSTSLPSDPMSFLNPCDHTYNKPEESVPIEPDCSSFSKDHTYDICERRDSLPSSVGIKRGRSSDDLPLTNLLYFKRKDFKKSPFLDQTYHSFKTQQSGSCRRNGSFKYRRQEKGQDCRTDIDNVFRLSQQKGVKSYATFSESNQILQDHAYEDMNDTAMCLKVSDLVKKVHGVKCKDEETKPDTTDHSYHSYVMPKEEDSEDVCSSSAMSDSGTESLNEEEEEEMSSTFERLLTTLATSKDHAYVK